MSEMVALRGHRVPLQSEPRTFYGINGVANTSINDALLARQFAKHPNPEAWEIDAYNTHAVAAGLYFLELSRTRRQSFSITLGYPATGVDFTTALSRKEYLTLSGSLFGGVRGVIQRNILSGPDHGLAAGLDIRYSSFSFHEQSGDCEWCGFGLPTDLVYILSIGGRVSGFSRKLPIGPAILSAFGGYAPVVNRPVLGIGVAIGDM
jgi:hypothetical protein